MAEARPQAFLKEVNDVEVGAPNATAPVAEPTGAEEPPKKKLKRNRDEMCDFHFKKCIFLAPDIYSRNSR